MMSEELKLASRYSPILMFDEAEPFYPYAAGVSVYRYKQRSHSCYRSVDPSRYGGCLAIEYAYFYDYDIQHLYDLEHICVYIDAEGKVRGCENSFHGNFLNSMGLGRDIFAEEDRVRLYVQPGKHAFMPQPELFGLCVGFYESCREEAGSMGILTPDIIPGMFAVSEEEHKAMEAYIKAHYSFTPTGRYKAYGKEVPLMAWDALAREIPGRMREEMRNL